MKVPINFNPAMKNFLLLFIALYSAVLTAQVRTSSISGEVRDAVTKQPLPGANIILLNTKIGTATDEKGYFVIKNIPVGVYSVQATFLGYEKNIKVDINAATGRNTTVYFDLLPKQMQTGEVTISGSYFNKSADQATSYRSLTPQEIRKSAGSAEDIFRVMQSLPGVATAGGKSAQLIVRGGSPDENLTLLDNIEIYNPIHFARTGESMGIISIINPSLLRGVDFMTGGFPAKYGDKMSSVFEMSLSDGNKEIYNIDMNANVAGFGTMIDGPLPGNGSMIFSLRRGFFDLITSLMNKPAAPRYYDAVGKATYDIDDKNRISLVGFYYLDQISREGTTQGMSNLQKYDYLTRDDYGNAIGLNWRSLIAKKAFTLTTLSFTSNGWNTLQGIESDRSLKGEDIRENNYSLKSELTWKLLPEFEIKTGFEVKALDSKHTAWKPADTTRSGQIVPGSTVNYFPDMSSKSAFFLQDTWQPFSRLAITTGLRYNYFSFTKENNFSPRFALSWYLTDRFSVNASYGKFYQSPALYQIALDPANTKLKSALATHYVIGVSQLFDDDSKGTIEIYYKDLKDIVVENDTTDILTNFGSGFAKGIEISYQKKFTNGIVGSASYSYSISKRKDEENLPEYFFEYDRPHIINLLAGFELSETLQIGFKFQYATGSPYTPVAGVAMKQGKYYVIEGEYNSVRYPDYHKLDIRVDKKFLFDKWTLTAYLDLWNVYNRLNVLSYSYTVDSKGVVSTKSRNDFGLLPIVGLSAQF